MRWEESKCIFDAGNSNIPDGTASESTYVCAPLVLVKSGGEKTECFGNEDKVSIEHILPQTPSRFYWRNQFREFSGEEIELLSCALGNLLPLSQSINSALQNDSFDDKKTSKNGGQVH